MLEEVRVTARHRTESAQQVPQSLFSLGQEPLTNLGISSLGDLQAQVPNLNLDRFPANNQTLRVFIRGVGLTDVQLTQDPAVGVYLDGVYVARSSGLALDIAELERIEVLRGPQGTLYGRNTTGGAINLVTVKPSTNGPVFSLEGGVGNLGQTRLRAMANLPLGEHVAVRVAVLDRIEDGFVNNNGPGGDFGDRSSSGAQLQLYGELTQHLTMDYAWDKSRIEYYNYTPQAHYPAPLRGSFIDVVGLSARRFVPYAREPLAALSTSVPLLPTDLTISGHTLNLHWQAGDHTVRAISG